jgi:hypothetical protein
VIFLADVGGQEQERPGENEKENDRNETSSQQKCQLTVNLLDTTDPEI